MKHLLFLMSDLEGGGAEKALVELLKSIDYTRYKVSLCLILPRGVYMEDIPKEVNIITLFEGEDSKRYRKLFRAYIDFKRTFPLSYFLHTKLRRLRYDAIISFMEGDPLLLHNFIFSRGRVNISRVHCDLYHYHYSEKRFHEPITEIDCYKKLDKIVFVSQMAMNNFDKLFTVDTPKYYLYNILDVDKVECLANNQMFLKRQFTIVAIGSLIEVKGFDYLIRAAKRLKDKGYSFNVQIIGRGDQEEALINLRDELGLEANIEFLGFQDNPYPYLKQADLLVSSSVSEGLSYVICEAFALAIPVVATKTAGAMELLDNNKYGILTEQSDEAIYLGIKRMMDDEDLRKEYAEKGKRRSEMFAACRIVNEFYKIINK